MDDHALNALLGQMTLDEKVGQMTQQAAGDLQTGPLQQATDMLAQVRSGRLGSILNLTEPDRLREVQRVAVEESRLGIPLIFGFDVIHGYKTSFPIPLAEAATFDLEAIRVGARVAGREAAAAGLHWTFAPMVDVGRDARWGRVMEGAGEDPWWGSRVAEARVQGFQGDDLTHPESVAACAKHFAGYALADGGRDYAGCDVSRRFLREVILPPFLAAVRAGCRTFMNAFLEVDGIPATGDRWLLREVLRREWGFTGMVVSDWGSVTEMMAHGVAADRKDAARLAALAGCDMEMCTGAYAEHLPALVHAGVVPEALIDESVGYILRLKRDLGLFVRPHRGVAKPEAVWRRPDHVAAARAVARKAIVLLQNEPVAGAPALPIAPTVRSIAVIGPLADNRRAPLGNWAGLCDEASTVSVLRGLRERAGHGVSITHVAGCPASDPADQLVSNPDLKPELEPLDLLAAVAAATAADLTVLCLGEMDWMSGENCSRANIDLPGRQLALAEAVLATGRPVVVVICAGRPLALTPVAQRAPCLVYAWHLGHEAGHALADVLFGDHAPQGRLPMSMPWSTGQAPVHFAMKATGRPNTGQWGTRYLDIPNRPRFPFGHGLGYTSFHYADLHLSAPAVSATAPLRVSITLSNTGARPGIETVQLYLHDEVASIAPPARLLRGIQQVTLQPGENRRVEFVLTVDDLRFWNADLQFVAEPGRFRVWVAPDAASGLEGSFDYLG